jgi:glycosyltransferase involved in cell wall biosynthesis
VISFIVPAYNEERLLGATLEALHATGRAVGEPYELVVVDDGSADQTALIARRHGALLVSVAHRKIAATRNSGARAANGDLFVFVDADTIVNEAVVRCAVKAVRDGAAGGSATVRFEGRLPFYARFLVVVTIWFLRVAQLGAGCFLFSSRQAFEAVGGFDETLYGAEDVALSLSLKQQGRFVVLPQCVTTSGRKLRAHSGLDALRLLGKLALRPRRTLREPHGPLAIWYAGRRDDPDVPT